MNKDNKDDKKNNFNTEKRVCPGCGYQTLKGMPGGREATCKNCGFKDPCCYD